MVANACLIVKALAHKLHHALKTAKAFYTKTDSVLASFQKLAKQYLKLLRGIYKETLGGNCFLNSLRQFSSASPTGPPLPCLWLEVSDLLARSLVTCASLPLSAIFGAAIWSEDYPLPVTPLPLRCHLFAVNGWTINLLADAEENWKATLPRRSRLRHL